MSKHTFEHIGNYTCTCGKTFTSSQKYNAHLSHCKIYLGEERYNANVKANKDALLRGIETQRKIRKEKAEKRILLARKEWEATDHYCEKCGKKIEYENIIGSGRFCSRACANSRTPSEETKSKTSKSLKGKKLVMTKKRLESIKNRKGYRKESKLNSFVKIGDDTLDITYRELDEYRKLHDVCDICGKPETCSTSTKKNTNGKPNNLCVEHDHKTKKFRGLVCNKCNNRLAWLDDNLESIIKYIKLNIEK